MSVRRTFQALRIAVNDEFSRARGAAGLLPDCLAPGGRVVILTFHSGEDRRVKRAVQGRQSRRGLFRGGERSDSFDQGGDVRQPPRVGSEAALGGARAGGIIRVTTMTLPRIRRRRSKLHGFGVFALEPITKNTRIIDYAGELVRNDESEAREERYLRRVHLGVPDQSDWSRDAASTATSRASSTTRAGRTAGSRSSDRTIWIRASRPIRAGEELTYDYATIGERRSVPLPAGLPEQIVRRTG